MLLAIVVLAENVGGNGVADRHAWSKRSERVLPQVMRIPLPLRDNALRAVNVYVLEGGDGITLVDTGWTGAAYWRELKGALRSVGQDVGSVRRVLVTHLHMDHVGQADRIRRESSAEFLLGKGERGGFEALVRCPGRILRNRLARLESAGARELLGELSDIESKLDVDWDPPDRYVDGQDSIEAGSLHLEVIPTPGHTQGHVSFFGRGSALLFAGDHVLPHITPSIGFEPFPTGTGLADFLSSLARIRDLDVEFVLPAHGPVFGNLRERVDQLVEHHSARLEECLSAISRGGATAYEVAERIMWTSRSVPFRALNLFNKMLAILETLAHFELLESRSRVASTDIDGALYFAQT